LKARYGRLDPAWSEVMHFRRGALDLPIDGGPDIFRAVYGEKGKDGAYTAVGGDTLIMFVDWDKTGRVSSESIHQFGSATLDASSKHYADQAPLFARMETKPVLFWRTDQDGKMLETYTPGGKRR
jgi:penicillin amidase/acyl-homoserine-lactone acylase